MNAVRGQATVRGKGGSAKRLHLCKRKASARRNHTTRRGEAGLRPRRRNAA